MGANSGSYVERVQCIIGVIDCTLEWRFFFFCPIVRDFNYVFLYYTIISLVYYIVFPLHLSLFSSSFTYSYLLNLSLLNVNFFFFFFFLGREVLPLVLSFSLSMIGAKFDL